MGDQGVYEMIILKWFLKKQDMRMWIGFIWLGIEPKRKEVTEGRITLHNEEIHKFYASLNIIRVIKSMRMRLAKNVARVGQNKNTYKILVGKPDGKRPLGRT